MHTEQQKQRKRERDRLKRKARQESVRASGTVPLEFAGDMSKALFEFARPLLESTAIRGSAEDLEARLQFAGVVWNAVVEAEGDPVEAFTDLVCDMETRTGKIPPALAILMLAKRKADEFGADARLFQFVDVQARGERIFVRAFARRSSLRDEFPTA